MSSPLVALGYRPETPVEGYQDMQKLQQNDQSLAAGRQQIQSGQMDIAAKQQALKDQQTIMQAQAANNGDTAKTLQQIAGKVTPQSFQALAKFHLDTQKDLAEIDDKELATQKDAHDRTAQLVSYARSLPPDQYAQQWPALAQKNNQINPQHPLNPNQPLPQSQLDQVAVGLITQEQYLAQETAKRQQQTANAGDWKEAGGMLVNVRTGQQMNAGGLPVDKQEMNDWLQKNPGKGPSNFLVWKAKNSPTMIAQGGFGTAGDPMVDMVGQGRVDLATALQRVAPGAKANFMRELNGRYPNFNQATYGVGKAEDTAFTSGSQGQQLTAIDTAREHMATFKQTAAALANGDVLAANKIGNYLEMQFGSDRTTNFQIARAAFAGEVGKAFAGANVAEGDRRELLDKINAASSPAQLAGYADTADKLLAGKQIALKRSYQAGKQGRPNFGEPTPGQSTASDPLGIR